jgi:hypothetical protein
MDPSWRLLKWASTSDAKRRVNEHFRRPELDFRSARQLSGVQIALRDSKSCSNSDVECRRHSSHGHICCTGVPEVTQREPGSRPQSEQLCPTISDGFLSLM